VAEVDAHRALGGDAEIAAGVEVGLVVAHALVDFKARAVARIDGGGGDVRAEAVEAQLVLRLAVGIHRPLGRIGAEVNHLHGAVEAEQALAGAHPHIGARRPDHREVLLWIDALVEYVAIKANVLDGEERLDAEHAEVEWRFGYRIVGR
jgi:hypothetical protein